MSEGFEELAHSLEHDSALMGAFLQAEKWFDNHGTDEHTNVDVVRRAWERLDMAEQYAAMSSLFNGFWYMVMASRKWLELNDKEPDSNTYLEHGDLEILDYVSVSVEDGMVSIDINMLQRLIHEIELLQHREKMRKDKTN